MAEAAIQFGPSTYRDGALERIQEARLLHQAGRYALCTYVAGLAVEGMLRGLCALRDAYFDEKHDLRRFGVRVAHLGLLRSGGRDHDFVARIQGIAQRWRNALRFADRRQLERLLVRLGILRCKHVDRGLKPLCNEYVEDCFAVVQRCELLWERQRSTGRSSKSV